MATTYQYNTEDLNKLKNELQNIGGIVTTDLKSILDALSGIDITGTPKEAIDSCVTSVSGAISKLTMPDKLGDALGDVATNLGMQEETVNKIFSGWSGGLSNISSSIATGIKGITDALTSTPTNAKDYTVVDYLSDTTKNLADSTVKFAQDTNKLIYSFTGNNIATNIGNLASNAVGTFKTIVGKVTSGSSSIGGVLSKLFNK